MIMTFQRPQLPVSGHNVVAILPFLATVILIFCSKSVFILLAGGHYEDLPRFLGPQILLMFAALTAPASVFLTQVVGHGRALLTGACITVLGLATPMFLHVSVTQQIVFASLFGSGVSMMFQASCMALVPSFTRSSSIYMITILALAAAAMTTTQNMVEFMMLRLAEKTILALAVLVFLSCICTAFIFLRGFHSNSSGSFVDLSESKLGTPVDSCLLEAGGCTENDVTVIDVDYPYHSDLLCRAYILMWWAFGIDYQLIMYSEEIASSKRPALLCLLSLLTLMIKLMQYRSAVPGMNNGSGFLSLGLVGISGLMMVLCPTRTDFLHHCLIFTSGFFLQIDCHQTLWPNHNKKSPCQKVIDPNALEPLTKKKLMTGRFQTGLEKLSSLNWLINEVCVEFVFAFGAIVLGFLCAYPLSYFVHIPLIAVVFLSDTGLTLMSAVAIILAIVSPHRRSTIAV